MSEILKVTEDGRYRVRLEIEQDSSPYNPRMDRDNLAHVVTVPHSHYVNVEEDGGPLANGWEVLIWRYEWDDAIRIFTRWARMFHGAVVRECHPYKGPMSVWYVLPEDIEREKIGTGRAEKVIAEEIVEYLTWAEGEVYYHVIEKNVTWQRKGGDSGDGIPGEMETWEPVDSSGGYIGYEWAKEMALEEFSYYENEEKGKGEA